MEVDSLPLFPFLVYQFSSNVLQFCNKSSDLTRTIYRVVDLSAASSVPRDDVTFLMG